MGTLYTGTTTVIVANTTAETTLLPTSLTIPANYLVVGTSFRVSICGVYATTLVPPTLRYRLKLGTVLLGDTGVLTAPIANAASHFFDIVVRLTTRSLGVSGTIAVSGRILMAQDTLGVPIMWELGNGSALSAIDTTINEVLDITAQWDTASIRNSVQQHSLTVELLGATQ